MPDRRVGRVAPTARNVQGSFEAAFTTAAAADRAAARFVGHLRRRGIAERSFVAVQAPNSPLLLASVWGALRAGYGPVVLGATLTERETRELLADVDVAAHFDDEALRSAQSDPPEEIGERLACRPLHFTSGTSGRPKAVWSGWLSTEAAQALVEDEVHAWRIGPTDVHLVCGPMSHSAPLRFPMMTLMAGGSAVVPPHFDAGATRELIEDGVVTTTFMAPTHLQRVLEAGWAAPGNIRLLAHAGAPCPTHVRNRARAILGDDRLREFYGSTEGQFTICTPREHDAHPGTVGRARPGRTLRVDAQGRIWCRVPDFARFTYLDDRQKTDQAWDGEWFTVGDLGRLGSDGYLWLEGRRSDLIITGGVNVYPAEVERMALELPGVHHAVAFGREDATWGQRVCLAVVADRAESEIRNHLAEVLAPYKRPKEIHHLAGMPLTYNGKIDRAAVPAMTPAWDQ